MSVEIDVAESSAKLRYMIFWLSFPRWKLVHRIARVFPNFIFSPLTVWRLRWAWWSIISTDHHVIGITLQTGNRLTCHLIDLTIDVRKHNRHLNTFSHMPFIYRVNRRSLDRWLFAVGIQKLSEVPTIHSFFVLLNLLHSLKVHRVFWTGFFCCFWPHFVLHKSLVSHFFAVSLVLETSWCKQFI